jgi:hypothetical protein
MNGSSSPCPPLRFSTSPPWPVKRSREATRFDTTTQGTTLLKGMATSIANRSSN